MAEDGSAYGLKLPALDRATVAALVAAAHSRGKLAVVQIGTEADAEMALEAGADGLAHVFADAAPQLRFLELVGEKKAFVIPTLTAVESTTGDPSGKALAADPHVAPYLTRKEADSLGSSARKPGSLDFHNALSALHQVRNARAPFLAGTDAPYPGTAHGASLHRELELLVQSLMTSGEALAAATSAPAAAFHLADRGRIAPGLRADLVMVQGYPTTTITDSRAILRVWKLGVEAPRVQLGRPAPKPPR
jgi:imidazolonepropionase-like amidohydrolase